jgi:hypothetical protein
LYHSFPEAANEIADCEGCNSKSDLLSFTPGFNRVVSAGHNNAHLTVSTVSLVAPFQAVPLDEDFILLRKTSLSVMLFLASNVVRDLVYIGMRDGKTAVSSTRLIKARICL